MPAPTEPSNPALVLKSALPTTKHARALVALLTDRLGERGVVVESPDGRTRQVFVRDAGGVVPWPLYVVQITDPAVLDAHEEEEGPSEPWKASIPPVPGEFLEFRFHPVPATASFFEGTSALTVNYDRHGRFADCVRPGDPTAFSTIVSALAATTDSPLELLAAWGAGLGTERLGPGRVMRPPAGLGGIETTWTLGRAAIRRALDEGRAPAAASYAVAEGVVGARVAFGPTPDAALDAWTRESRTGAVLRNAPSLALVPLAASRDDSPAAGEWRRYLDDRGGTVQGLRTPWPNGFRITGAELRSALDEGALDAARRAAARNLLSAERRALFAAQAGRDLTQRLLWIRCRDEHTGLPVPPRVEQSAEVVAFDLGLTDAGMLRHSILEVTAI